VSLLLSIIKLLEALASIMEKAANAIRREFSLTPQRVRWCSANSPVGTGLLAWTDDPATVARREEFVPWPRFQSELERNLLPRMFADPRGYRFVVGAHHGKEDWLMHLVGPNGLPFGDVWFGVNPDGDWAQDGLVRVGSALRSPHVWQTYRRLSDGSYERLASRFRTLEQVPEARRRATPFSSAT